MNFLKKLKDKIHELRQETEKWPEQARAQVAENMIKSEQSLMKARYEFMNSRLQTKNLPLYKSMDIFLEQFEEKQKEYLLIKEEFIKKNKKTIVAIFTTIILFTVKVFLYKQNLYSVIYCHACLC